MSSRYGRKQKRAARKEIDFLRNSIVAANASASNAGRQYKYLTQRFEDWDADIRSTLGPYTSFSFSDQTYRVDHVDSIRQMPIMPPISSMGPSEMVSESVSYYMERIFHIVSGLDDSDIATLRRYMHLTVKCGSDRLGEAYYAMSEYNWDRMKRDPAGRARLVSHIAPDLLRCLLDGPKKKKPVNGDDLVPAMERDMRHAGQ